jgi:hypothetical protein
MGCILAAQFSHWVSNVFGVFFIPLFCLSAAVTGGYGLYCFFDEGRRWRGGIMVSASFLLFAVLTFAV